jgi:hypothetical protein
MSNQITLDRSNPARRALFMHARRRLPSGLLRARPVIHGGRDVAINNSFSFKISRVHMK